MCWTEIYTIGNSDGQENKMTDKKRRSEKYT